MAKKEKHSWEFTRRFRKGTYGWKSYPAINRIKEAVSEIKKAARKDPILGAEGAVLFLEKLVPAIESVDGSSGAIGTATNKAIDAMVAVIAKAPAEESVRAAWLERLFDAYLEDGYGYMDVLPERWGELCAGKKLASAWADRLVWVLRRFWVEDGGDGFFKGKTVCIASMFAAGRYDELLLLLDAAPHLWWYDRQFGVKALAAMGKVDEALEYANGPLGLNDSSWGRSELCESILIEAGRVEEAWEKYGVRANLGQTNLGTFRATKKKYPDKSDEEILDRLMKLGNEPGKWFATVKSLKKYDLAIQLANASPCDPKTLNRAARDHVESQPRFALGAAIASLRWISIGHGYDIEAIDVLQAIDYALDAARTLKIEDETIALIRKLVASPGPQAQWVSRLLDHKLSPS